MSVDSQYTVLIVEDDTAIRTVLANALQIEGYRVLTAGDGMQGLGALETERPHLVLLDLQLPGMDGPTMIATARQRGLQPIVCVLSARPDAASTAAEIGAAAVVEKPFDLTTLLDLTETLLGSPRDPLGQSEAPIAVSVQPDYSGSPPRGA